MKFLALIVLNLILLAGCNANPVKVDYEPSFDFTAIKSYAWAADYDAAYQTSQDGLMDKRVQEALADELSLRGVVYDKDKPDMLIGYRIRDKDKLDYYRYPRLRNYGHRQHRSLFFYDEELVVFSYVQRVFMLDVLDSQNQLIWRGSYETRRKEFSVPEDRIFYIRDLVARILLNFPR